MQRFLDDFHSQQRETAATLSGSVSFENLQENDESNLDYDNMDATTDHAALAQFMEELETPSAKCFREMQDMLRAEIRLQEAGWMNSPNFSGFYAQILYLTSNLLQSGDIMLE